MHSGKDEWHTYLFTLRIHRWMGKACSSANWDWQQSGNMGKCCACEKDAVCGDFVSIYNRYIQMGEWEFSFKICSMVPWSSHTHKIAYIFFKVIIFGSCALNKSSSAVRCCLHYSIFTYCFVATTHSMNKKYSRKYMEQLAFAWSIEYGPMTNVRNDTWVQIVWSVGRFDLGH